MRNSLIVKREKRKIKFKSKFLLKMIQKVEYNKKRLKENKNVEFFN